MKYNMDLEIIIDPGAGPCFGVSRAIQLAENILNEESELACLGDLIHNKTEIDRLIQKGLKSIGHCQIVEQSKKKLLFRAHGEPTSTYRIAETFEVTIVDATCPIVKQLQEIVAQECAKMKKVNGQLVLFGDINHAEVIGLKARCDGKIGIVRNPKDLETIQTAKPTVFISQTTKFQSDYNKLITAFKQKRKTDQTEHYPFKAVNSVCKQVAKRDKQLKIFLKDLDLLLFVSDPKSSNGNELFKIAKRKLPNSFFISSPDEMEKIWFKQGQKVGISGATSTPIWLLEEAANRLKEMFRE